MNATGQLTFGAKMFLASQCTGKHMQMNDDFLLIFGWKVIIF